MVIVKEIENLAELDGFEWSHNGRVLYLKYAEENMGRNIFKILTVFLKPYEQITKYERNAILQITRNNLIDLDFLGLRVKIAE